MRTLVVGDVHGCKDELRALLDEAQPDRTVLVGDLFTKGPKPRGVWRLIEKHNIEAVLGNHDEHLLKVLEGKRTANRSTARCIEKLNKSGPAWQDWLRSLPLFATAGDFTVVHAGLHPSGDLERTSRATALYRRRWPRERRADPLWHQVYWGERRVIFGHDAVRGLVRVERDDEPLIIGLDSGCVYGGQLSGYLVEEDRVIQVPAKQVYKAVG